MKGILLAIGVVLLSFWSLVTLQPASGAGSPHGTALQVPDRPGLAPQQTPTPGAQNIYMSDTPLGPARRQFPADATAFYINYHLYPMTGTVQVLIKIVDRDGVEHMSTQRTYTGPGWDSFR